MTQRFKKTEGEEQKLYGVHPGRVVETKSRFRHLMALALDPRDHRRGLVRCILSRRGDVGVKGFADRSELHLIHGHSLDHYSVGGKLGIKHEAEMIGEMRGTEWEFIGLEDPDIWYDPDDRKTHVYFTIPLRPKEEGAKMRIYLGHAEGRDLDSLEMTEPVLVDNDPNNRAKEVAIAPKNNQGIRLNLFESADRIGETRFSTIRVAICRQAGPPWEFGETVLHPARQSLDWCAGHASPGPLLPRTFIDLGEGKCLGIINGRQANKRAGKVTLYGVFSVGLMIYDYERGKIDWISPWPLIQDQQAKTITFASQFIETASGRGILYAHVDDSFVRAYDLDADALKSLLPSTSVIP